MPAKNEDRMQALYAACQTDLGDPNLWYEPDGYPESLALCIIDAIYSTGAQYSSVVNVVRRYREDRAAKGGDADTDGTTELLANIEEFRGPDGGASTVGNRRPTSTRQGAPLKAEALDQVARKLHSLNIFSVADLRAAAMSESIHEIRSAWVTTSGQRSGITWDYALMLARVPGVKADRMVIRYVSRAVHDPSVRAVDVAALVREVAERAGWNVIRTDHAIWRFESGRPVNQDGETAEPDVEVEQTDRKPPTDDSTAEDDDATP